MIIWLCLVFLHMIGADVHQFFNILPALETVATSSSSIRPSQEDLRNLMGPKYELRRDWEHFKQGLLFIFDGNREKALYQLQHFNSKLQRSSELRRYLWETIHDLADVESPIRNSFEEALSHLEVSMIGKDAIKWDTSHGSGDTPIPANFDSGWQQYLKAHNNALVPGADLKHKRFLVCQPAFGLGNRLLSITFCFALALATNRSLLIHWNCAQCQDNQLSYPFPLNRLLQFPVEVDAEHLYRYYLEDEIRMSSEYLFESTEEEHIVSILCSNLKERFQKPILIARIFRFHPQLLENPFVVHDFESWFGRDEPYGFIKFHASLGRVLISPLSKVSRIHDALKTFMSSRYSIAIQLRLRLKEDSWQNDLLGFPEVGDIKSFVECAVGHIEHQAADAAVSWLLVIDRREEVINVIEHLAAIEGCVASCYNCESHIHNNHELPFVCPNYFRHEHLDSEEEQQLAAEAESVGGIMIITFYSNSRLLLLAPHLRRIDRNTLLSAELALAEMLAIAACSLRVVSEFSTFARATLSTYPAKTLHFTHGSLYNRCYSPPTSEPNDIMIAGKRDCTPRYK